MRPRRAISLVLSHKPTMLSIARGNQAPDIENFALIKPFQEKECATIIN
jgi:hypothetical protein